MVAPSSSSPTLQQTQQFLTSVLSQRGPDSLPYTEDVKCLIRHHLLSLSQSHPSLQHKTASFTHNDGRSSLLLHSHGTVPILFHHVTYNIPVLIWLSETYPRHAPFVFVNPTRDMVIKRQHPFVNPSGLVSIPYLQNWIFPSSNLVDLVRNLSSCFGNHPPLFSQPRPNPNPKPSFNSSGSGSIPYEDAAEVYKRDAINKLVENVNTDVARLRKANEEVMEGMFSAQSVLRGRESDVSKGLREMQGEKEGLEQELQMVLMNTDVLEQWVSENEGKLSGGSESLDVDEMIVPSDSLSKQMLECTANDLAIEDVVYALDKSAQQGCMPFDLYLKNVRLLSRQQFLNRATCGKVRAVQMQGQVTSMASRASPYGV